MRKYCWLLVAVCVLFLTGVTSCSLLGGGGSHEEEAVTLDQVPEAVKATILTEAGGATLTEIERETEDGAVVYEAEFEKDGKKMEITVAEDGTLISTEVEEDEDDEDDEDEDDEEHEDDK